MTIPANVLPDVLPARVSKNWWAIVEGDVTAVTGFSCAPEHPTVWWCPEVGLSMTEGYHLFATEKEALRECLKELSEDIKLAEKRMPEIKTRLYESVGD